MPSNATHSSGYPHTFRPDESFALALDAGDPLKGYRDQFHIPARLHDRPTIYFCSHSLGLQPKITMSLLRAELDNWARLGVEGHFKGPTPWYTYHSLLCESAARLVGARTEEVIHMNGLTINLHLMMETFYRPTAGRYRILMDEPVFPSDLYAVGSQVKRHGYSPDDAIVVLKPRTGEDLIRSDDIEAYLNEHGGETAVVLWSGLNFLTGQRFDLERVTAAAHRHGCLAGFDLAHAAGNVPLQLHDWQVDFAVWCTYKYLNSGPGAVAGCFVHQKHGDNVGLPRLAGWWGNDPETRFRMQLEPNFLAQRGAAGWQVSNPAILALVPIRAALALYDEAGLPALRAKSVCLTSYLEYLLEQQAGRHFTIITPRDPAQRGCQLSILVHERPREILPELEEQGIIGDFREPNIIRVAPAPFYNTFHEVWKFAQVWRQVFNLPSVSPAN